MKIFGLGFAIAFIINHEKLELNSTTQSNFTGKVKKATPSHHVSGPEAVCYPSL
jgi:hypothetical protein